MPEVPGLIRVAVGLLSVVIGASAIAVALLALTANARPAWTLFGFEVVIAVSCWFGVRVGRGAYRDAPGLALACVAGSVVVGSVLGYLSLNPPTLGGVGVRPFLGLRLLGGAALAGAGAACVLSRHPRSKALALKGVLLGAPVAAAAAVLIVPALRAGIAPVFQLGPTAQLALAAGAFVLLGGLLCASVDRLIRAFELGRPEHFAGDRPRE